MAHPLPTAVLGRTGLEVTRLGYGAGHRKPMNNKERETILNSVLDSGVNLIDTAISYGNSEELIGRYISHRSSEFHVATKGHTWTSKGLLRGLHKSLRRLKADYVDVFQLHNPTVEQCERGRLVEALQKMREAGKVRWIGVSTTLPHLPMFLEWGAFDVFQVPYSALERDHEGWITRSAEAGTGILVRGGAAQGEPGVGTGSPDRWRRFQEAGLDDLREENESRTAFMLRFTLTHAHSHTNIVGTTNPEHLRQNTLAILKGPLPTDVQGEAVRRLDAAGVKPDLAT